MGDIRKKLNILGADCTIELKMKCNFGTERRRVLRIGIALNCMDGNIQLVIFLTLCIALAYAS